MQCFIQSMALGTVLFLPYRFCKQLCTNSQAPPCSQPLAHLQRDRANRQVKVRCHPEPTYI